MKRAAVLLTALLCQACWVSSPEEPTPPPRATGVASLSLAEGAELGAGDDFTVTLDGAGVVSATFGPRQISKRVTGPEDVARFRAEEFPDALAPLVIAIEGRNERRLEKVRIDTTPPELVRVEDRQLARDEPLRLYVWDAYALGRLVAVSGDHRFEQALPRAERSDRLTPVDLPLEALPEGTHALELVLSDALGNELKTRVDGITVDRMPPQVAFSAPAPKSQVTGPVTLHLAASDTSGPPDIEVRAGGAALAQLRGPVAALTFDSAQFPEGPLLIEAVARDPGGNVSLPAELLLEVAR